MIAYAFQHRADKFGFSGVKRNVEEHTACVRILKRATVAVQPGRENYAARARGDIVDDGCHILIQVEIFGFKIFRDVFFLNVNADFVQGDMVFHPFQTLARSFKFRKVVEFAGLRRDGCRDHCGYVHGGFVGNGRNPARSAAVNMRFAKFRAASADADKRSVHTAAEDFDAFDKPKFFRGFFGDFARAVGRRDKFWQVVVIHAAHFAHFFADALVFKVK